MCAREVVVCVLFHKLVSTSLTFDNPEIEESDHEFKSVKMQKIGDSELLLAHCATACSLPYKAHKL